MKKLKRFSIVLLLITSGLLIGFLVYEKFTQDTTPPEITCPEEAAEVSMSAPEAALLEGVTARDDQSGDVTDAVVVEKLSGMNQDGTRTITYAVIDEAGNVGRKERRMRYTDYEKPRFALTDDLRFDMNGDAQLLTSRVHAYSALDGDLSAKIKFIQTDDESFYTEGLKEIELQVTDSAGVTVTLPVTVERYTAPQNEIQVKLSEYIVYLTKGDLFDPEDYINARTLEGTLTIEGKVNSWRPGIYTLDYVVEQDGSSGRSRLIVVVEDQETEAAE